MAIGVIKLTKAGRYKFAVTFVVLDVIQSLLGFATTGWSVYICIAISPTLYTEKSEVTFVFAVIGMYGTHVLFHGLIGIKICYKCYMQAHKKSTRSLLFLWTLAACNTMLNIFILTVLTVKISKHIVRAIRHSMERGVQNYLKDPTWKSAIDKLQVRTKCCGINSYKDWYEITWIDKYHINIEDNLVKELRTSNTRLEVPVTPWSCCRVDFPMQCFHDPFQQTESAYLWKEQPSVVLESIYNEGCLVVVRQPIQAAFTGFIIVALFIFLVQILAILVSRILYTSCRNALILDDPEGIAPGWIFGRGDCGWSRGAGLAEIMGLSPNQSTANSSKLEYKSSSKSSGKLLKLHRENKQRRKSATPQSDAEPVSSGDEAALMLS